jgi:hypothetical protein
MSLWTSNTFVKISGCDDENKEKFDPSGGANSAPTSNWIIVFSFGKELEKDFQVFSNCATCDFRLNMHRVTC